MPKYHQLTLGLAKFDSKPDGFNREIHFAIYACLLGESMPFNEKIYEKITRKLKLKEVQDLVNSETPITTVEEMRNLANSLNINFYFYEKRSFGKIPKKLMSIEFEDAEKEIHVVTPDMNEYELYHGDGFCLTNLKLVVDVPNFLKKVNGALEGCLWTILAMHPKMIEQNKTVGTLLDEWESDGERTADVSWHDEELFFQTFGLGFDIRCRVSYGRHYQPIVYSIYQSRCRESLHLEYSGSTWPRQKTSILRSDTFIARGKEYCQLYKCDNEYCFYQTNKKCNYLNHIKTCSDKTRRMFKQKALNSLKERDYCIKHGFMNENQYLRCFATFDIEAGNVIVNEQVARSTCLLKYQRILTCSVTKSWIGNDTPKSKVFIRESMDSVGYFKIVADILQYLAKLQSELAAQVPENLLRAECEIQEMLYDDKAANNRILGVKKRHEFKGILKYINSWKRLKVYSWNGKY